MSDAPFDSEPDPFEPVEFGAACLGCGSRTKELSPFSVCEACEDAAKRVMLPRIQGAIAEVRETAAGRAAVSIFEDWAAGYRARKGPKP